jgi:hypothetical protein
MSKGKRLSSSDAASGSSLNRTRILHRAGAHEDASAYMLNPRKRRSEQTTQGIDPTGKGAAGGPDTASRANTRREDS